MARDKIVIGPLSAPLYTIEDAQINAISDTTALDIVGAELSADQMEARLTGDPNDGKLLAPLDYNEVITSDGYTLALQEGFSKLRELPYGEEVRHYRGNLLRSFFYSKNVDRIAEGIYKITAQSSVGILGNQQHVGGVYTGQTFAEVVAEIIDNAVSYSVADDVAAVTVFGWLPVASKRRNLHQLLFATGAALTKDADGNARFVFLDVEDTTEIPDERFYYGGNIDYSSPASAVEVTEHSFYTLAGDEAVTLFDNTDGSGVADNTFVTFREAPIHDLAATGTLSIVSYGVNYAIVSGTGTLTGQKYTHTTKIIRRDAGGDTAENVVTVTDATLVSAANSENVAKRVMSYYSSKKTVGAAIVNEGEKPGQLVSFTDPYGDTQTGYIASAETAVSSILKSQCEIITDYVPTGQGNNYSSSQLLTGSGTFTVGENGVLAYLIGGGDGGDSGGDGENSESRKSYASSFSGEWPDGGDGGPGGSGGSGAKVFVIALAPGTYTFSCGVGGRGGVSSGTEPTVGESGGATTISQNGEVLYSSEDGASSETGVINIFTGEIYAVSGESGVAGGKGGQAGQRDTDGYPAENVTYKGETWYGGERAAIRSYSDSSSVWYGGAGGGAAVGGNGASGSNLGNCNGGKGGDAIAGTSATIYGSGGNGGHGGGGAGGGGLHVQPQTGGTWYHGTSGNGGGIGGSGGDGAEGCLMLYE